MTVISNAEIKKKAKSKQQRKYIRQGFLFASPWIIGFLGFTLIPMVLAVYYSFTNFDMFNKMDYVGFSNYVKVFTDRYALRSMENTLYITLIGVPVGQIFALLLALMLNQRKVKGMPVFRTIFYLPTLVPLVSSIMLFMWVLNGENGLLNIMLSWIGIKGPNWLQDPAYTKTALIIMDTWRCGGAMIIYLAALRSVPETFYEAASLDGANGIQKFFRITIPHIAPTIQFNGIMSMIGSFQYFTQGYMFSSLSDYGSNASAGGGPRNSMLFYCLHLYRLTFKQFKVGYACAMAVVLAVFVMICSYAIIHFTDKKISYTVE